MKLQHKNLLQQAAIAAAVSAGFNSDWAKSQFALLKSQVNGNMRPWVPWALAAGAAWMVLKK